MDESPRIDARREHYSSPDHDNSFFPSCTHPDCVAAREVEEAEKLQQAAIDNAARVRKWTNILIDVETQDDLGGAGPKYWVKCCGSYIQSMNRHHMAWCSCGKSAVDGGDTYVRRVGSPEHFVLIGPTGEYEDE